MKPCRGDWRRDARGRGIAPASVVNADSPVESRANNAGAAWANDEDAYLIAHPGEPARETALKLGRTLWAIKTRRTELRKRGLLPPHRAGDE